MVAGGGTALIEAIPKVAELIDTLEGDEKIGAEIVKRAIEEPVRQIAENAGLEGSVIVREVAKADKGIGYDAATNQFVDMIEEGIIDPTKVTRSAIQNAASIAGMFLTTEVAVAELPEAGESAAPAGMGGGMPMM